MKENSEQERKDDLLGFSRKFAVLLIPKVIRDENSFCHDLARAVIALVTYTSLVKGESPSKELNIFYNIAVRDDLVKLSKYLKILIKKERANDLLPMLMETDLLKDTRFLSEFKITLSWGLANHFYYF